MSDTLYWKLKNGHYDSDESDITKQLDEMEARMQKNNKELKAQLKKDAKMKCERCREKKPVWKKAYLALDYAKLYEMSLL